MNDKICLFTLQNKLKNIIIVIVNLRLIFTHNATKTFESTFVENVNISQIKIQNTKKKNLEKDEKNLINNVIIQQL